MLVFTSLQLIVSVDISKSWYIIVIIYQIIVTNEGSIEESKKFLTLKTCMNY